MKAMRNSAILVLFMLFGTTLLFSGGGGQQATRTASGAPMVFRSSDAANPMPIARTPITLRYAGNENLYRPASYATNLPVWQEFERRTGIRVEWEVSDRYAEVIRVRIAANVDMPDVFNISGLSPGTLYEQGVILALDDIIANHAPNAIEHYEKYPITRKLGSNTYGEVCAFVIYRTGQDANLRVPIIRKDWLDKLGLNIPVTLDDYYNVLRAFKEQDPNGNGRADEIPMMAVDFGQYGVFGPAFGLTSFVQEFWAVNGVVQYSYILPEYRDYLTFLNRLYREGLMDQDFLLTNRDTVEATIPRNVIGMAPQAPGVDIRWDNFVKSAGIDDVNHIQISPPRGRNGNVTIVRDNPYGRHHAVAASSRIPVEAVRWLDYIMYSVEGTRLQEFGIEGLSHNMVNGRPVLTNWTLNNPDGLDANSALRTIGAFFDNMAVESLEFMEGKLFDKTVTNLKPLQPYAADPLITDQLTREENDRYMPIYADISTYVAETVQKFVLGTEPLANWDQYVQRVRSLGIDELVRIRQAAYNRVN